MKTEPSPVQPGDIIAGKYCVDRILGIGGMGAVVAATHRELREVRALKFLLPSMLENAEFVERFHREARAVLRLKSEHVARVLDIGKLETGAPFIVMEYLDGQDLGAFIKQQGPVSLDRAVTFVLQAMDAVAEAHEKGIIHRDLKPANLFLTTRPSGAPCVKVLDFGISKMSKQSPQDMDMTRTHTVLGSPQFMSPEQMRASRDVDTRTDIWALGVILYQLTTGKVPFRGRSSTEIIALMFSSRPEPPSRIVAGLPTAFDAVVMRCLRLDPDERYATVAELARALLPFAPESAAFLVERIAGYASASREANMASSVPSAPTDVPAPAEKTVPMGHAHLIAAQAAAARQKVEPASASAPTRVLVPSSSPEDSLSTARTKVLEKPRKRWQRSKTEVLAQGPSVSLPSDTTVSKGRPSPSLASYAVGLVVVCLLVLVVLFVVFSSR